MKKFIAKSALGLAAGGAAASLVVANVHAATSTSPTTSRQGIARYTVKSDRLAAEAEVLGMSTADLQNALKTQTMKQVLAGKGLTRQQFADKVKTRLQSDLAAQGYSQDQINRALSHAKRAHNKN
jgi:SOS response regulatory protein OraA/RecX